MNQTPLGVSHLPPASARPGAPVSHPGATVGTWNGSAVTVHTARVAGAGTATPHGVTAHAQLAVDRKRLSQRSVHRAPPLQPMQLAQIVQAARLSGQAVGIRQLAGRILRSGQIPSPLPGRAGAVRSYLALQSVASWLDEDEDEEDDGDGRGRDGGGGDDRLAALMPIGGAPGNSEELADMLQQSGDDPEAMAELLKDVEGLPKDPHELFKALRLIRYDPPALAAWLRERQGFPADKSALRRLRQQVEDAVRELERTDGGLIRASLNAAPTAAATADPEQFLDAYGEMVHEVAGFAETFKRLLERFGVENMRSAVESMKKALGDDLNAVTPSNDPVRLGAVLRDLSHMYVSTTLLDLVEVLVQRLERMRAPGAAPAPAPVSAPALRPLDASVLLGGLLSIVGATWVSATQFEALGRDLGLAEGEPMIQFLTGGRGVVAELPEKVYQSDDARRAVLTAAQDALDAAIDREEALAEMGEFDASREQAG